MRDLNINRLYRLFATGLGFIIFGVAGFLFQFVLLPYTLKSTAGDLVRQKKARKMVSASWRFFTGYLTKSGTCAASFHGFERLGKAGQVILCNHPSLLDVVFMISRLPEINCLIKQDLQKNPVMMSQIKSCGYIPNSEDLDFIDKINDVLQKECLLIFPEGTRTKEGKPIEFGRGAVSLGLRSAKVITPVVIKMNPPNWKKNQPWYHIPAKKPVYEFIVGDDINPQDWLREKPLPIAARRLNEHLQTYFNERVQQ